MGTDGGSEADTGRGTHRRSRLPTPHLAHLAPPHSQQLLRKNKNFAFFGGFWRAELAGGCPEAPRTYAAWSAGRNAFTVH